MQEQEEPLIEEEIQPPRQEAQSKPELFEGQTPRQKVNICKRLMLSWATPLVRYAKAKSLHINIMGNLRNSDKVEHQIGKLKAKWKYYKATKSSRGLLKAVLAAFKFDYALILIINLFCTLLNLVSPYLVNGIINFIQDKQVPFSRGVLFVSMLIVTQALYYIIEEHLDFYQKMIGVKSTNALIALIYRKQLKLSSATNKKFSQGEFVNFVQVDSQKIQMLSVNLTYITRYPLIIIVSFTFLFYFLGLSFFSGVTVFVIAFAINLFLSRVSAKLQKEYMKRQDARLNMTTESLNNIKMLKLYSWTDQFAQTIQAKRNQELNIFFTRLNIGMLSVASLYFFPQILSAVVFSVFIGSGNTLDLITAYTVLTVFNILKEPLRNFPYFIGQVIELLVSMTRIQNFLLCDTINTSIIQTLDFEEGSDAIVIKEGNFHWGVKLKEEEAKEKKGEVKEEKAKKVDSNENSKYKNDLTKPDEHSLDNSLIDHLLEKNVDSKTMESVVALKNINLNIKHGEFVCIIGDVGSGKSSLLSALIGDLLYIDKEFLEENQNFPLDEEMKKKIKEQSRIKLPPHKAPINIYGKVAYVQQNPWIQNKTIRENILFGKPFDELKYAETISICELERDLEILPAGDFTEIGEKGINLSGGQKARVSLARAVYSDKSIILMDDPISALDANVRKKIFKNVFLGKFKDKTRILVTHAVDFLHFADTIILLKKGEIVLKGSFNELKDSTYLKEVISIHKGHLNQNQQPEKEVKGISTAINEGEDNNDDLLEQVSNLDESDISCSSDENEESDSSDELGEISSKSKTNRKKVKSGKSYSIIISDSQSSVDNKEEKGKMIQDENLEETTVGLGAYKQYLKYLGGWKFLVLSNLAMTGFTVFKILNDYQVGNWASSPDQQTNFGFYCGLTFTYAIVNSIFVYCRCAACQMFGWRAGKLLHIDMIAKVLNAPINLYFDVTPIGRIINKFSKDLSVIELNFHWEIGSFLAMIYQCAAVIIVAAIVVQWILLIIPIILFISIRLYLNSIRSFRECTRIESLTKSPLLSFFSESFNGVSTIRTFRRQNDFKIENNKQLNNNIIANQWSGAVQTWFSLRMDLIASSVLAFSTVFCLIYRDSANEVFLALMLTYILLLQDFLLWTIKVFGGIEQRMVNVDRCLKLLEVPQENTEAAPDKKDFLAKRPSWPEDGQIQFHNVNLKYRPTTEIVLKNLTFDIKPSEKVGVVGRTGAGKSTICLSLSRIVEIVGGYISIDGVDIRDLPLNEVRKRITVIPQDPTMFTGTLRFNLDPAGKVEDERIIEVLKEAKLEDLLQKDPKGLDQEITENGANLSSGEKQLICITRAILRKSKIVILDEATANIDVVTEKKIQSLISLEFKDSTMITIAHRLNTIIGSDRVLVLSYGEVLEYDSPNNLMQDPNSEFSKLLQELKKHENNT